MTNHTLGRAHRRQARYSERILIRGRLTHPHAPHGLGGYQNHGCRCPTCTTAMRDHGRDRYAAKAAR